MWKSKRIPKKIYFCFIDYSKAFDCVDYNKLWNLLKSWEYQTTLPASWEICMQVKKQQLELDMEQQTGSKLGKEYVKAYMLTGAQPRLDPGIPSGGRRWWLE